MLPCSACVKRSCVDTRLGGADEFEGSFVDYISFRGRTKMVWRVRWRLRSRAGLFGRSRVKVVVVYGLEEVGTGRG